jgi:flagellin
VSNVALASGALSINGAQIGASSSDGVSYTNADSSAIAKAAAINAASGLTGVTATVSKTEVSGIAASTFGVVNAGQVMINGVDIGAIGASQNAVERGVQTAAAINAKTSQTGVTATASTSTGALALTASDGRNITVSTTTAGGEATGLITTVTGAAYTSANINSTAAFKINGVEIAAYSAPSPGLSVATTQGATGITEVSDITFKDLTAGQSLTVNGLTYTAGTATVVAADVAAAFAGIAAA